MKLTWALAVLALGCTPRGSAAEAQTAACGDAATPAGSRTAPVLMSLQTRNHEVVVYSTTDGLRFTVAMGDHILLEQLDEAEFARSFPGLHQHFETAFAEEDGAWAGL